MEIALREDEGRVLIPIRAMPRAGRTAVVGVQPDGALKVALAAPPVEGAANEELVRFLGRKVLGVAPSRLEVVRGETGRDKVLAVEGVTMEEVRARLTEALG
jgi:uncharacterized protein